MGPASSGTANREPRLTRVPSLDDQHTRIFTEQSCPKPAVNGHTYLGHVPSNDGSVPLLEVQTHTGPGPPLEEDQRRELSEKMSYSLMAKGLCDRPLLGGPCSSSTGRPAGSHFRSPLPSRKKPWPKFQKYIWFLHVNKKAI